MAKSRYRDTGKETSRSEERNFKKKLCLDRESVKIFNREKIGWLWMNSEDEGVKCAYCNEEKKPRGQKLSS
jgi:hypothetical protein